MGELGQETAWRGTLRGSSNGQKQGLYRWPSPRRTSTRGFGPSGSDRTGVKNANTSVADLHHNIALCKLSAPPSLRTSVASFPRFALHAPPISRVPEPKVLD